MLIYFPKKRIRKKCKKKFASEAQISCVHGPEYRYPSHCTHKTSIRLGIPCVTAI